MEGKEDEEEEGREEEGRRMGISTI